MEVAYLFGMPQTLSFAGVVMDADRVASNTEHQGNCYEDWVAFNRSSGMRNSALEHQIPEQLFSTETEAAEGVSTAKALSIAAAQGQRIYTLTQSNQSQLANITIDDGARVEIQAALAEGMEVTVHQAPISLNGWTGSGYAILDPDYGVGAYKISGGESGAFLAIFSGAIMMVVALFMFSNPVVLAAAPFLFGPLAIGGLTAFMGGLITILGNGGTFDANIFNVTRLIVGLFLVGLFGAPAGVTTSFMLMMLSLINNASDSGS